MFLFVVHGSLLTKQLTITINNKQLQNVIFVVDEERLTIHSKTLNKRQKIKGECFEKSAQSNNGKYKEYMQKEQT